MKINTAIILIYHFLFAPGGLGDECVQVSVL